MFSNSYQSGFISIFFSVGSNPLSLWDRKVKNGHIRRVIDDEVKSLVLEISGTNVATTFISCPILPRASLGIKLPFFVMVVKNMKKYFTFEIQILDDKDMRRRFRVSNFQSTTKVRPFCTTMPIGLNAGWNQVQFNLADFTKRAYGSTYIETMRVQIHANVRVRRLYFTDTLYSDEDMPNEFKLFGPPKKKAEVKAPKPSKTQAVPPFAAPPPPSEKPLEEAPPPPSPSEFGPKTSPTGHEEGEEETKVSEPEAPPPPTEEEKPPVEEEAEIPEGVELVPMKDIPDEEFEFDEGEFYEEFEIRHYEETEGDIFESQTEATEPTDTEEPSEVPTDVAVAPEPEHEPASGPEPTLEPTTTTEEPQATDVETTEEPATTEDPQTETEGGGIPED